MSETFNSSLLIGNSADIDWNNKDVLMTPGEYTFDIYINNEWKGKYSVIVENDNNATLSIKRSQVGDLGIRNLDDTMPSGSPEYIALISLLHGGKITLKPGRMAINLEIPQAWVNKTERNWVAPAKWDQGISGLYTNYNLNYYNFHSKLADTSNSDNIYLFLNSGLNILGWHLIDNATYMRYSNTGSGYWKNSTRYLERSLANPGVVIRIGDNYTTSEYFDSIRFRGLTLNKSRRMLPDSEQTYMPEVSGIASTSSLVSVYQDGHVIYQITVPPGPFAIRDLMPTGSRSDLTVNVRNAGGATESFIVPFSSIPDMLRPGSSDYHLNIGEVNAQGYDDATRFAQYSYSRGVNNYLTAYGGFTISNDYKSWLLGSAVSLPWVGSVSASAEQARYRLSGDSSRNGEKYSVAWSKYFPSRTNVTLASYYYRTQDYASFSDYSSAKSTSNYYNYSGLTRNSKQAISASINQPLSEGYGKLSFSAYWRDYWNNQKNTKQYSLSYSNKYNSISYAVSVRRSEYTQNYYSYDQDFDGNQASWLKYRSTSENNVYLSVTVPMSIFGNPGSISTHTSVQKGKYASSDVSVNGNTGNMDYSMVLTNDNSAKSKSADLYGSWNTSYSRLSTGLTESGDYRQVSLGANGSLLAWSDGVLASSSTGNTFVIIDAPGISNAAVNNDKNVTTGINGKALVTSAVAYRQNNFRLNVDEQQESDTDLLNNILNVAPYEGSITYLRYQTDTRKIYTLDVRQSDGKEVPFGSPVLDEKGGLVGYVSQGSQLYLKSDVLPNRLSINTSTRKNKGKCVISPVHEDVVNICK